MKKYQQMSLYEREQISVYKALGKSQREIAKLLDRDHRTIGRELKRNAQAVPMMRGYVGCKAHLHAKKRKQQSGTRPRLKEDRIRCFVQEKLKLGWTPEQIAAVISKYFPGVSISHEAIYNIFMTISKKGFPTYQDVIQNDFQNAIRVSVNSRKFLTELALINVLMR